MHLPTSGIPKLLNIFSEIPSQVGFFRRKRWKYRSGWEDIGSFREVSRTVILVFIIIIAAFAFFRSASCIFVRNSFSLFQDDFSLSSTDLWEDIPKKMQTVWTLVWVCLALKLIYVYIYIVWVNWLLILYTFSIQVISNMFFVCRLFLCLLFTFCFLKKKFSTHKITWEIPLVCRHDIYFDGVVVEIITRIFIGCFLSEHFHFECVNVCMFVPVHMIQNERFPVHGWWMND